MVADVVPRDALPTATLKLISQASLSAVEFIRGISAVNFPITPLTSVIAGSVVTSLLLTYWVTAVYLVSSI